MGKKRNRKPKKGAGNPPGKAGAKNVTAVSRPSTPAVSTENV